MAEEYVAEGLLEALAGYDLDGRAILIARAAVARDLLPNELARRGARWTWWRLIGPCAGGPWANARPAFSTRKPDWITFTSSSTVQNLVDAVGAEALRRRDVRQYRPRHQRDSAQTRHSGHSGSFHLHDSGLVRRCFTMSS